MTADGIRLDQLLVFLRLTKSRSLAQALIASGHCRINGQRADRPGTVVRAGSVLTMAQGRAVRVIRVDHLPVRRGPSAEAQSCYTILEAKLDAPSCAS